MHVNLADGRCRTCSGQLDITDADDATMTAACTVCGDIYLVEIDAFSDGGMIYYPAFLLGLERPQTEVTQVGERCRHAPETNP